MPELTGQIVTPKGLINGTIVFSATVETINPVVEANELIIMPGMLDLHIHGGGGGDVMDGVPGFRSLARTHACYGTTSFLATTVTAEDEAIDGVLEAAAEVMSSRENLASRCLGVHLEGPYLSANKLGAQPPMTRNVNPEAVSRWFKTGVVKVMTYSPEQDLTSCLPGLALQYGVRLQVGHSGCDYHEAKSLFQRGIGVTHLFNAMTGIHHRSPGVAQAALLHADYSEIICDGIHVVEPSFHLAARHIPNLYSVTDSTAAAGMKDGQYKLGVHDVYKSNGAVRLADGTLAGSAATAEKTVQTLSAFGLHWDDIASMTATRPANWIGLHEMGRIAAGCRSDFVVYRNRVLESVWIDGNSVFSAGG